jgi:DNA-binding XRE family transcriptional regulator
VVALKALPQCGSGKNLFLPLKKNSLEIFMEKEDFIHCRKDLKKTQKQIAQLLGTSLKAIHSYEQGWRSVPAYVERQLLFLLSRMRDRDRRVKPCWVLKECPPERRSKCPAWEFRAGKLCWFINGTICEGAVQTDWQEKMKICRSCEVLAAILPG